MLGQHDEAHAKLDEIMGKYPRKKDEVLFQHAAFYGQQGRYQDAYEALVKCGAGLGSPSLNARLMLVNALMNLNLGIYAMEVAEGARGDFPGSPHVAVSVAAIWDFFGFREQALFTLRNAQPDAGSPALADLLYRTGRFHEAEKMSRALGTRIERDLSRRKQLLAAAPAELAVTKCWRPPLTAEEAVSITTRIEEEFGETTSPFIRRLHLLMIDWHKARGGGKTSDLEAWRAAGRDIMEEAAVLHRLGVLLARQREYEKATAAVEQALERLPRSAILWRIMIALTGGEPKIVSKARSTCPVDPEIWLAELVTRMRDEGPGDWVAEAVNRAAEEKSFAVETMVRAGDFFLRKGMPEVAISAARDAMARSQGYLPAHVLGLRSSLAIRDSKTALSCALNCVDNALDPTPFYKTIVRIKSFDKSTDADIVTALEYLQERHPDELEWSERLGTVYFQKGDTRRSLNVLLPVISERIKGVRVESVVMAAEAARLEGEEVKAIRLLQAAYAEHPEDLSVLNNLAYSLAQNSRTAGLALELLPRLLALGGNSFAVLDTAAVVCLRCGDLASAKVYMERALAALEGGEYLSEEVNLNAAEILLRSGELEEAKEKLRLVRGMPGRSHLVDMRARELLAEIEKAMAVKGAMRAPK